MSLFGKDKSMSIEPKHDSDDDADWDEGLDMDEEFALDELAEEEEERKLEKEEFFAPEYISQARSRCKTNVHNTKAGDDRIENYKHQHPGYRSLSTPIDDVTKYLAEACLLNGILRSPGMRHPNGFTIIVPDAAKLKPLAKTFVTNQKKGGKTQEDHFIEIQHAVDMAINVVGNTVFTYSRPIGYFMDLALYLNDPRNTYALVTDNNQYKKQIPLRAYAGNDFMDAYLASKLQIQVLKRLNNGQIKKRTVKTTVQAQIKSLVVDMMRQGEYSELTNALGRELAIVFGFNDIL